MFITVLFILGKKTKKMSTTEKWINKLWHTPTTE